MYLIVITKTKPHQTTPKSQLSIWKSSLIDQGPITAPSPPLPFHTRIMGRNWLMVLIRRVGGGGKQKSTTSMPLCVSLKKNSHALPLSLICPLVLCDVVVYLCNCIFLQPSGISTRSWWAGKGSGGLAPTKKKSLTLHKSSVAGPGAWGSPSCSCWPFMKASLKRFASGKLCRVLVCCDIDGRGKRKEG